jgi:very-short-patch-repair endonuclease
MGVRGFDLAQLDVARARDASGVQPTLATLHQLRAIRAHDVLVVRGVVTETALRAIWCEAARYAPERLREVGLERIGLLLDQAHRLGLVTWAGLHEIVDDIHERGRSGTVIMRELAAKREPGSSPTESRQETQFEKVLEEAHVRPFRRQQHLGGHEPIGRCDFADEELPLAVEVNSLTFHTAPTDRAADERRYQALMDAGFTIAVIWEDDIWSRQAAVVRTIAEARGLARMRRRAVVHSPGCPWPRPRVGEPD